MRNQLLLATSGDSAVLSTALSFQLALYSQLLCWEVSWALDWASGQLLPYILYTWATGGDLPSARTEERGSEEPLGRGRLRLRGYVHGR